MATQKLVLDHATLGAHLADGFRNGTSLIESPQHKPPAVGLPVQRTCRPNTKNYGTLPRSEMYEQEGNVRAPDITAQSGDSPEARSSRRLRNQWGKPRMTNNVELTTLEQVVVRQYANKFAEKNNGRDIGPMRFGTPKEVAAVNLAHGGNYKPRDEQHLRRDRDGKLPQGITVDLAKPDDGMFRVSRAVENADGTPKRDARGGVVEEVIERARTTDDPPAPERRAKTLYHVDDLKVDSRPARVWTAQNHTDKGEPVLTEDGRPAPTPSGTLVRGEDGKPRMTNHDKNGQPIEDRVGAIQRGADGKAVMVAVEKLGDRAPKGQDWGIEQTRIAIEGVPADPDKNRRERPGINQRLADRGIDPIAMETKRGITSAQFSVTKEGVPTITLPTKFRDKDHELTERARGVAHAEQWANPKNPNHKEAVAAAKMTPKDRASSPEYAACELTAQHAAMAAVTRSGGTYQPQPAPANEKLREHWAKQVSTPEGLDKFGRATDQATRVCDAKQPARDRGRENRANRSSDQIEEHARAQQARGGPEQSRSQAVADLLQGKAVPVRGAGRPAGGAAPAAPAAPEKGQKRA